MGRTVGDAALMLDAMVGEHAEDPLALPAPAGSYRAQAERHAAAAARRLLAPISASARWIRKPSAICAAGAERLAREGVEVVEACPDFSGAGRLQDAARAGFVARSSEHYDRNRDKLKPDVIWNIEHGLGLDAATIARAERARGRALSAPRGFFQEFDLLICPAAHGAAFRRRRPAGSARSPARSLDNYVEWIRITYAITLTGSPVVALPCGITADGRPVGLQLVGRPRGEAPLIAAAAAFEALTGLADKVPLAPRGPGGLAAGPRR